MKTPREATRGLDCWVTRLAAYSQLDQFATNVDAAREAARRGDYEAAAALMGRTVGLLPSTVGSVRETMRFARSAATLNTENVRRYLAACFAAGTPIVGEYGSRPVEDYRVGDKVWARNENDPYGPLALKEIEECFQTEAEIWHVHVGGQVIRATAEHPFWVVGRGWIETKHLRRGDVLIGRDGPETVVDETLATGAMERVYNFRVADYHTYFVGEDGWHFDVWAHNACEVIPRRGMNKTTRSSGANSATVYGRAHHRLQERADRHSGSWKSRARQSVLPATHPSRNGYFAGSEAHITTVDPAWGL